MLKKLTFFSFISSLILFIIILVSSPFVSLNIIEGITDSIKGFQVQDDAIIKIENINKIHFEAYDNTKINVVQTAYKSSEILIKYNSIVGNTVEYTLNKQENEMFITQNLIKNTIRLPNLLELVKKFDNIEANVIIFIPQNVELVLNGNTYYEEYEATKNINKNIISINNLFDLLEDMFDNFMNIFEK